MAHMSTIRLLDKLGENHDGEVYKCKNSLAAHLEPTQVCMHSEGQRLS